MSLRIKFILIFSVLVMACSTEQENTDKNKSEIYSKINVENINYDYNKFDKYNKQEAQEYYVDFSYNFIQTSRFKRHLNTIGVMIDTTNYQYIKRLSYSYKKAGEHQKAMHLLNLAISTETNSGEKQAHRGYAAWSYLYFYRDYRNTIKTVDQLLIDSNQDTGIACHGEPCLLLKGQALLRLGRYKEAIAAFTDYQNYQKNQGFDDMDNSLIVFYKGRCYAEIGESEKAMEYFKHLVKDNPHAEAYYQLAKLYFKDQNKPKAKIYLEQSKQALENGYSFKEPYFERFDKVFLYNIEELETSIGIKLNE